MTAKTMTFEEFQQGMIAYAKEVQGDRYPGDEYYLDPCWKEYWEDGDEYYLDPCWKEYWEDGDSPSDAVISDMGYWE